MSDCRFGVSPVNYPDPDPDHDRTGQKMKQCEDAKHGRKCWKMDRWVDLSILKDAELFLLRTGNSSELHK